MSSYKELEIYNLALEYFIEVHKASLTLPKHELYEQGSQVRRSAASVKDNIVEGYGRRKYKKDFIKFLVISHASLLECKSQLDAIFSIYNKEIFKDLSEKYDMLGGKIHNFIIYVETSWRS